MGYSTVPEAQQSSHPSHASVDLRSNSSDVSALPEEVADRAQAQAIVAAEKRVLELIATGAPLPQVLDTLVRQIEANSSDGMLCSVLLVDEKGERLLHGAAPSLPDSYNQAVHGLQVGPCSGSCGTAAFERKPVFVNDIAADPRWADFKDLAAAHSLGACCSTPIFSSQSQLLGTVAMYYPQPHHPGSHDCKLIERATQLAAIVIERNRTEQALREGQARLTADLADMRQLQSMSAQLTNEENIAGLYEKVLDALVAIMRSDFASMQMLNHERGNQGELHLLAFRGFTSQAAKHWEWVGCDSETSCGVALRTRSRIIVSDVHKCDFIMGTEELAAYLDTGIHAMQTTPLLSRRGSVVGMISTHWAQPHQPTERELGLLDVLARQAADLIERKQAEAALRESEERFRALANNMSQFAWMADPKGWIFWYNQQWFDYTGTTLQEMQGWGWKQVHHPEHVDRVVTRIQRSWDTGEIWEDTFPLRGKDGNYRWFLSRAVPIRDAEGKIGRWFGTNTDITERRQSEEALRRSEKLAAVGRMAATVAHEINNPLESVTNLLYLLRTDKSMSAESRKYLQLADQELDRVAHVARQTLGFYRDSSAPAWLDAGQIIDDLLEVYDYRLRNREIALQKEVDGSLKLFASAGEFRQVFSNLLINAIDAVPAGGGKIRIRTRATREWNGAGRSGVRLSIGDSGSGIDSNQLLKIFEPFYTTKREVGTGLGLWLSRSVVEKHEGRIRVRSRTQRERSGTVFSIFWPDEARAQALAS